MCTPVTQAQARSSRLTISFVKGGVKPDHWGGVKVGQRSWQEIRDCRGGGRLERRPGLALFPATVHPDLVLWELWSRNRHDEVEGVYSHQTALSLYELSDLNPAKLHMTVPARFRRNSEIPGILILHYADLPESDIAGAQGFKFTRPLRTILDLVEANTVERSFLRQAIRQALQRGLITRHELRSTKPSARARKLFDEVMRRVAEWKYREDTRRLVRSARR